MAWAAAGANSRCISKPAGLCISPLWTPPNLFCRRRPLSPLPPHALKPTWDKMPRSVIFSSPQWPPPKAVLAFLRKTKHKMACVGLTSAGQSGVSRPPWQHKNARHGMAIHILAPDGGPVRGASTGMYEYVSIQKGGWARGTATPLHYLYNPITSSRLPPVDLICHSSSRQATQPGACVYCAHLIYPVIPYLCRYGVLVSCMALQIARSAATSGSRFRSAVVGYSCRGANSRELASGTSQSAQSMRRVLRTSPTSWRIVRRGCKIGRFRPVMRVRTGKDSALHGQG